MRCHIILHAPFEGPGALIPWIKSKGLTPAITHPYQGDSLPEVSSHEPVIFMGGPQSAREYQKYDYLEAEVQWIKALAHQEHPLLGICLGAQLIAESLGAKTERSPEKEVGVFPIQLTAQAKLHSFMENLPPSFDVLHWHNDMPGLPEGAQVLATSEGCPRQVILFAHHILGFQCHFEATPTLVAGFLEHAEEDLKPSRFTQTPEAIQQAQFAPMNQYLEQILNRWYGMLKKG